MNAIPPLHVDQEGHMMRLDHYLTRCWPSITRSQWQKAITQGCIYASGKVCTDKNKKVHLGEIYTVTLPAFPDQEAPLEPMNLNLVMLYEDEKILVLDKPAGLVVHPGAGHDTGTLVHGLLFHCGPFLSALGGPKKPGLVHRLDKDTSGVMVVAKDDATHAFLTSQFSQREIEKIYWAFVGGNAHSLLTPGTLETQIGRDGRDRQKMAVLSSGGRQAITSYKLLHQGVDHSLMECRPKTGRTHQIRVHCAHLGNPILGDKLYGGGAHRWPRQALHAHALSFRHPNGERMTFKSPLPRDLEALWIEKDALA